MSYTLNFYQFQFNDDFINNAIVAQTNAIRALRPSQFFDAARKKVFRQVLDGLDNPLARARRQFSEILARGFLPLNAKGHGVSAPS